jgi:hypothetical protein
MYVLVVQRPLPCILNSRSESATLYSSGSSEFATLYSSGSSESPLYSSCRRCVRCQRQDPNVGARDGLRCFGDERRARPPAPYTQVLLSVQWGEVVSSRGGPVNGRQIEELCQQKECVRKRISARCTDVSGRGIVSAEGMCQESCQVKKCDRKRRSQMKGKCHDEEGQIKGKVRERGKAR